MSDKKAAKVVGVIGAAGHIGNNICRALIAQGYTVKGLIHTNSNSLERLSLNKMRGDILDLSSMRKFCADVDIVIHAAGKISINGDKDGSVRNINVNGTKNIVEACLISNVEKLIYISSIHALEQAPEAELDESRQLVEGGFSHDLSKSDAEKEVMAGMGQGLDTIILTPTAVIGPYDFQPSLMGQGLLALYHRRLPALVKGGFDFVDVRDVAKAAITAIDRGKSGEKYLLSGMWKTVKELAKLVQEITGRPAPKFTSPNWLARIGMPIAKAYSVLTNTPMLYTKETLDVLIRCNRNITCLKAKQALAFHPRPLVETLNDTFSWYKESGLIQ